MKTKQKLVIIALGKRDSGKSNTWYEFFGRTIRTGYKKFSFEEGIEVSRDIFVRNASFEEWGDEAEDYFEIDKLPEIIFCSVQYKEKGIQTINFFKDNGYYIYIQWLNPGYKNSSVYEDNLKFEEKFKSYGEFHIANAKEKEKRVLVIKDFLFNWLSKK